MILYFAGSETDSFSEIIRDYGTKNALTTYWTLKDKPKQLQIFSEKHTFKQYFLDSGAFSAWTRGVSLEVKDYAKYLLKNKDYITHYANLDDKISEVNTINNLKYLESQGLHPIPVWHFNSRNFKLLKELLDKYDYIAIGGVAGEQGQITKDFMKIFKMAFSYGKDSKGRYRKKFHGFGITHVAVLIKYPWYSVDSTSWLAASRFGEIHLWVKGKIKKVQRKDTKKLLEYWLYIPKEFRDFNKICDSEGVKNYHNRLRISALCFKKIEKHCTDNWQKKGLYF